MQESMLATTRDALYGWTAERLVAQAGGARPAGLSLSLRSRLSGRGRGRPARASTPANCPTCSAPSTARRRSGRRSRTPRASARCPTRWSTTGPASRAPASRRPQGQPAWPAFGTTRPTWHSPMRRSRRSDLMPGMYELHEEAVCRRQASGDQPWNWNVGLASPPPREVRKASSEPLRAVVTA